jgi:hypothetical protein
VKAIGRCGRLAGMARLRSALWTTSSFRLGLIVAGSGLAFVLVGCNDALTITPGGHDLPRCDVQIEVRVEELDKPMLHDCNAEGVTIRLPDDWGVQQVQAVGTTSGWSWSDRSGEFGMVNWGLEGVGVSFRDGDERKIWGTSEAARQRQSAVTP